MRKSLEAALSSASTKTKPPQFRQLIVRLVRDDARPQEIRVVTSHNTLINPVNAAGASVYPAESFRNLIDPPQEAGAEYDHGALDAPP
jgi:hypothetical protein